MGGTDMPVDKEPFRGPTPTITRAGQLARITAHSPVRLTPSARARMLVALNGYVALVMPRHSISFGAADRTGWWRVDLQSGETLGIMDSGLHQSLTEDFMTMVESWNPAMQTAFAVLVAVLITGAILALVGVFCMYVWYVKDPRAVVNFLRGLPGYRGGRLSTPST